MRVGSLNQVKVDFADQRNNLTKKDGYGNLILVSISPGRTCIAAFGQWIDSNGLDRSEPPPPIMLAIISFVDIQALLMVRLLCKPLKGLIGQYQRSISKRASQVLWHRVPGNEARYLSVNSLMLYAYATRVG